uniref:Rab-GAP TBC domain-containing protein n=2 Tax=Guillardia theta TaxID=55529 RepID=A0A7S4PGE2_GUITH|mmetsp:Transcript_50466/g.157584  ORF Transcript_50466/g.157584 Transcript_50466/m.157584 type:complete len:220 (+) Transcript_50466:137-796(+)
MPKDADPPPDSLIPSLRRVLRAYARRNKQVGYCQGLNFIAGLMLLFLREDQAFWLLCVLIEDILPGDYYAQDLSGCNVDLRVFRDMLSKRLPKLWKHFQEAGLGVEFFCLEWFIAIYAKTLPTETMLRVWDSIFLEGYKIIFRIGLGILELYEKQLLCITEPHELFAAMQDLGKSLIDADSLIKVSFGIQMKRTTVIALREKHRSEVIAERESRQVEKK